VLLYAFVVGYLCTASCSPLSLHVALPIYTVSLGICRWLGGEMRGYDVTADLATAAGTFRESGDLVAHDVALDPAVADDVRAGDLQPVTTQRRDRDQVDSLPDHHRDLSTDRRAARAWGDAVRQQDDPRSRPVAERELQRPEQPVDVGVTFTEGRRAELSDERGIDHPVALPRPGAGDDHPERRVGRGHGGEV